MAKDTQFEDLFQQQLEDLYDAEKQIVAALPKMIAASSSEELGSALATHLDETKEQVTRLEKIFEEISQQPSGKECKGMKGLLEEGETLVQDLGKSAVLDVAIIGAARKVEHYEIAAYTAIQGLAEMLGSQAACELLQETLQEEMDADDLLAELSERILTGDEEVEEEEDGEDEDEEDGDEDEEEGEEEESERAHR